MRCLFSCSAAALVFALAGCGGQRAAQPFADPSSPLDVKTSLYATSSYAFLRRVSFRGWNGRTVNGYLVVPRTAGRHPAVVYLHGAGGTDADLLMWAIRFARAGGVALTISQPNNATSWRPLAVNARRALDLLASRSYVDPHRLGVAGPSLGAETAAVVAGVDPRPRVFALMSCRGRPIVRFYVRRSHARFLVQAGLDDQVIPPSQLQSAIDAIRGLKTVRWYAAGHLLVQSAYLAQLAWLRAELHPAR